MTHDLRDSHAIHDRHSRIIMCSDFMDIFGERVIGFSTHVLDRAKLVLDPVTLLFTRDALRA